jgi:hypothetical protein
LREQQESDEVNTIARKLLKGDKIKNVPTPKKTPILGKRKYTKRKSAVTEPASGMEDIFIDDEIQMSAPTAVSSVKPSKMSVKSEPIEC